MAERFFVRTVQNPDERHFTVRQWHTDRLFQAGESLHNIHEFRTPVTKVSKYSPLT